MANYGLYKNITPGSITSATSSLRQKVNDSQSKLGTYSSSLTDGIWKCTAKTSLFKAFNTMNDEVYKNIKDYLDKLDEAANLVSKYKDAEAEALKYQGYLSNKTDETPASDIEAWNKGKADAEKIMTDCETKINGLK